MHLHKSMLLFISNRCALVYIGKHLNAAIFMNVWSVMLKMYGRFATPGKQRLKK